MGYLLVRNSVTHSFISGYYFLDYEHFRVGYGELKSTLVCVIKKEGNWGLGIETQAEEDGTLAKRKEA